MTGPLTQAGDEDDLDPYLKAVADAILDGTPIDWTASAASASLAAISAELRLVADLAALHRSIDDGETAAQTVPRAFPWQVGSLTVVGRLGQGTSGEVFRAWDGELHRDVAIKLLFDRHRGEDDVNRALAEGRLLARVRHPNVVAVHAVERIEGRVGLVTEYVHGSTLAEVVRRDGPLDAGELVRVGIDLCRALHAVHSAALLHRDVKAQNVLREEGGRIVLMDFGAGRTADAPPSLLAGTPLYLAPEVLDGAPPTQASDIYSLGVLLHFLGSGGYPVTGDSLAAIRARHADGARTRLRDARRDLPRRLSEAIDRATDPDPARRVASTLAFEGALRASRRPLTAARLAGLAAMAAAAVGAYALWPRPLPAGDTPSASVQRVNVPAHFHFGGPSFDGRYLTYVEPKGSVIVVHRETGASRTVAAATRTSDQYAYVTLMAPDGGSVAYSWNLPDGVSELRVVNTKDRWPQGAIDLAPVTIFRTAPHDLVEPREWSRDGVHLLATLHPAHGATQLLLINADGSGHRLLKTFEGLLPRRVSLSPDGRFIAYDAPAALPAPRRTIFIANVDGPGATLLLSGNESGELPLWAPDGRSLLFVGERDGSTDLWSLRVVNGARAGSPRRIARHMGDAVPIGVTAAGDLYYSRQVDFEDIRFVSIDGTAAHIPPALDAARVSRRAPAWSPDGRTLAHFVIRGLNMFDTGSFIRFVDSATGQTRDVAPRLSYFGGAAFRWFADGRALLVRGRGLDGAWAIYRVDTRTGDTSIAVPGEPDAPEGNLGLAFDVGGGENAPVVYAKKRVGLVARFLQNGEEQVVARSDKDPVTALRVSPDGSRIAYTQQLTGTPRAAALRVRDADGLVRELLSQPAPVIVYVEAWRPDARDLLYAVVGPGQRTHLWLVPASGGTPRDTGIEIQSYRPRASLRQDDLLAYDSGRTSFEEWVLKAVTPGS